MSPCPPRTQLQALEAGTLEDPAADTLLGHVETCAACAELLEQVRREDLDARLVRLALRDASTVVGGAPAPAI